MQFKCDCQYMINNILHVSHKVNSMLSNYELILKC